MFKNATQIGKKFAAQYLNENEVEDTNDAIFAAMAYAQENYKSAKTRQAFADGASEWANMIARIRTRKMVYGK